MTPFRGRPEFPALVAAVRAGDCHAGIFCDWLEEFGATAADVIVLYALPRALHVLRHEGGPGASYSYAVPPAEDDSLRPVLAEWADRHGPPGRGAAVRSYNVWQFPYPFNPPQLAGRWSVLCGQHMYDPHFAAEPAARRELKRRVLGLFADVRVPCPACSEMGPPGVPHRSELVACRRCNGSGTVAPADLIPPEPVRPGMGGSNATVRIGDGPPIPVESWRTDPDGPDPTPLPLTMDGIPVALSEYLPPNEAVRFGGTITVGRAVWEELQRRHRQFRSAHP